MSNNLIAHLRQQRKLLTASEVAELLGFQRNTIYQFAKDDLMPSVVIRNSVRFDPMAVAQWVEDHQFRPRRGYCLGMTQWVFANLVETNLPGKVPPLLAQVLATFPTDWLTAARCTNRHKHEFLTLWDELHVALEAQLTIPAQRELLMDMGSGSYDRQEAAHA